MSSIAIFTWERWINHESCTSEREITLDDLKEKQWHGNLTHTHFHTETLLRFDLQ